MKYSQTTNNSILKEAKVKHKCFTEEGIQTVNKHMKKMFNIISYRKMQIK